MFQILVVDDDRSIRFFAKEALELNHYTVYTAKDGKEALDIFDNNHIDLVIVDIMMPNMDGVETLHKIKAGNLCKFYNKLENYGEMC